MNSFLLVLIGFSGGLVVGGAVAAFITVLGVITRIVEIVKAKKYLILYQLSILTGILISTLLYLFPLKARLSDFILVFIGLFMGIFVGMIASALAEVLNIIPLIEKSLKIGQWIYAIIFALIAGKIIGSLVYWLIPGFY